jgi:hypothetical protein
MRKEMVATAAVIAVALAYLYMALQLPASASRSQAALGPRAYPMLIGVLLLLAVVAFAVQLLLAHRAARREMDAAGAEAGSRGHESTQASGAFNWRGVTAFLAATVVYLWLLDGLGFILATALYLFTGILIVGNRRPDGARALLGPAVFAIATSVIAFVLFAVALNLRLPAGPLLTMTG